MPPGRLFPQSQFFVRDDVDVKKCWDGYTWAANTLPDVKW